MAWHSKLWLASACNHGITTFGRNNCFYKTHHRPQKHVCIIETVPAARRCSFLVPASVAGLAADPPILFTLVCAASPTPSLKQRFSKDGRPPVFLCVCQPANGMHPVQMHPPCAVLSVYCSSLGHGSRYLDCTWLQAWSIYINRPRRPLQSPAHASAIRLLIRDSPFNILVPITPSIFRDPSPFVFTTLATATTNPLPQSFSSCLSVFSRYSCKRQICLQYIHA